MIGSNIVIKNAEMPKKLQQLREVKFVGTPSNE